MSFLFLLLISAEDPKDRPLEIYQECRQLIQKMTTNLDDMKSQIKAFEEKILAMQKEKEEGWRRPWRPSK